MYAQVTQLVQVVVIIWIATLIFHVELTQFGLTPPVANQEVKLVHFANQIKTVNLETSAGNLNRLKMLSVWKSIMLYMGNSFSGIALDSLSLIKFLSSFMVNTVKVVIPCADLQM